MLWGGKLHWKSAAWGPTDGQIPQTKAWVDQCNMQRSMQPD
jgi:hypothetical protein